MLSTALHCQAPERREGFCQPKVSGATDELKEPGQLVDEAMRLIRMHGRFRLAAAPSRRSKCERVQKARGYQARRSSFAAEGDSICRR